MPTKRLAVVGAGVMGGNHIRVAHNNSDFEIAYIIDSDIERASERAEQVGATALKSVNDLDFSDITAAIVAVPSHLHGDVGKSLLKNNIHVLMEKPLSLNIDEANELKTIAHQNKLSLMVGHIELFNPTITELVKEIGSRAVLSFRAERLGFVEDPSRLYHGVVDDLMLHDIAIARYIIGNERSSNSKVLAATGRMDTQAAPDPAQAFVSFDGIDAYFRSSRVYGGGKKRIVEVDLDDNSTITADLLTRNVKSHRSVQSVDDSGNQYQKTEVKELIPMSIEPLMAEQRFFAGTIDKKQDPGSHGVSAEDAIKILEITNEINRHIREQ